MSARTASSLAIAGALVAFLAGCSTEPARCAGSFDGEVVPTAEGYESRLAAVEAWAVTSPAPDSGWEETETGARVDDWVVETSRTEDGGWLVESLTCDSD